MRFHAASALEKGGSCCLKCIATVQAALGLAQERTHVDFDNCNFCVHESRLGVQPPAGRKIEATSTRHCLAHLVAFGGARCGPYCLMEVSQSRALSLWLSSTQRVAACMQ